MGGGASSQLLCFDRRGRGVIVATSCRTGDAEAALRKVRYVTATLCKDGDVTLLCVK